MSQALTTRRLRKVERKSYRLQSRTRRPIESRHQGVTRVHRSIRKAAEHHGIGWEVLRKGLRTSGSMKVGGVLFRYIKEELQKTETLEKRRESEEAAKLLISLSVPDPLLPFPSVAEKWKGGEEESETEEEPFSVWLDSPIGSDVD